MEVYWGKCTGTSTSSIFPITHIKPIAFQLPVALQPPWGEDSGSRVVGRWASHRVIGQRRNALALYFWAAQICFPIFSWRDNLEQRSGPRVEARRGRCEYCGRSVSPRVLFGTLLADRHYSPHGTAPRSNEASNQITSDSVSHNKSIRVAQR